MAVGAAAPPHPQLWSMPKPYPTSVTVSRTIFLKSVEPWLVLPVRIGVAAILGYHLGRLTGF